MVEVHFGRSGPYRAKTLTELKEIGLISLQEAGANSPTTALTFRQLMEDFERYGAVAAGMSIVDQTMNHLRADGLVKGINLRGETIDDVKYMLTEEGVRRAGELRASAREPLRDRSEGTGTALGSWEANMGARAQAFRPRSGLEGVSVDQLMERLMTNSNVLRQTGTSQTKGFYMNYMRRLVKEFDQGMLTEGSLIHIWQAELSSFVQDYPKIPTLYRLIDATFDDVVHAILPHDVAEQAVSYAEHNATLKSLIM
ncbi:MAG: hypothetical protein KGH72_00025 [Candidatus Micrarchaeota archaeon]|nr:hypothetical protein [Candidatus Micrarchaeota archaeon]